MIIQRGKIYFYPFFLSNTSSIYQKLVFLKELKITKKKFLEGYCELNVKIYPKSTIGVLTYPSTFFPKRIIRLIKKNSFHIADSFFVVPQVVLKRENKWIFRSYLKPLIKKGIIYYTIPENPNHPNQKYFSRDN